MLGFCCEGAIRQQLLLIDLIWYPDCAVLLPLVLHSRFGIVWSGKVGVLAALDDSCIDILWVLLMVLEVVAA